MGCLVRSDKDAEANVQQENAQPVIESVQISPNTGVVVGSSLTCYAIVNDEEDGHLSPAMSGVSMGSRSATLQATP